MHPLDQRQEGQTRTSVRCARLWPHTPHDSEVVRCLDPQLPPHREWNKFTVGSSALEGADAEAFEAQVRFLKSHFDTVSPDDLPEILSRRKGRAVLITFDDGYADNYELAFPTS